MRCLFASAEIFPLAKTGGLADVSGALPIALAELGLDMELIMPAYGSALDLVQSKEKPISLGRVLDLGDPRLIRGRMPSGLPIWLVDCPELYDRKGGPYTDEQGNNWPDNAQRFALLNHVVADLASGRASERAPVDIVHVQDWHLGLVPALLAAQQTPVPASLLTIHNLAFLGLFPAEIYRELGLPQEWFNADAIEFYGQVSFLKAGIRFANHLTTVSPLYAKEIQTPEFGCGLQGLLQLRANDLTGILNGIDCQAWEPADGAQVPYPFNASDLSGKRRCKQALQEEFGLEADPERPLIAFVSRLTEQKMADTLPPLAHALADRGAQLLVCGEGEHWIESALNQVADELHGQVAVRLGYEEPWARRILAGADILVAPARFEPCGLMQMYAMRFGTIPVVRAVGGLADTVIDHVSGGRTVRRDGTGFQFKEPTPEDFLSAIDRALELYQRPLAWRAMQMRAMNQDFSWRNSAPLYRDLYMRLAGVVELEREAKREILKPTGTD